MIDPEIRAISNQSLGKLFWTNLFVRFRVVREIPRFKDKYDLVQSVHGALNAALTATWCMTNNTSGKSCGVHCNCLLGRVVDVYTSLEIDPVRKVSIPSPILFILPDKGIDQQRIGNTFVIQFIFTGVSAMEIPTWIPVFQQFSRLWRNKHHQWCILEQILTRTTEGKLIPLWRNGKLLHTPEAFIQAKHNLNKRLPPFGLLTSASPVFFDGNKQYMQNNNEYGPPLDAVLHAALIRLMLMSEVYCGGTYFTLKEAALIFSDLQQVYPIAYRTNGSWRRKSRKPWQTDYVLQGRRIRYILPEKLSLITRQTLYLTSVFGIGNFTSFGMGRIRLQ